MKIIHLIQKPQNRGAETFASQLANHQVEQGHQVKMIAVFPGEGKLPWQGELLSLEGRIGSRFLDAPAWKRLAEQVEQFRPDIIQANAGDTLKYAVFSKLMYRWNTPIVFRNASEVGRYLTNAFQKHFNSFLYRRLDQAISVSAASKADLVRHFPFLEGRTEVIPVGLEKVEQVDPVAFKPNGGKHLVHVGGFSFEKNHQGLLRIFESVVEKEPRAHLHLVGDGPLRKKIEEEVKARGLQDKICFHGFVNNPLSYIKAADVLVLPSIIEGLPGVLLEAMYCKVPVVANDVGGIGEIVKNSTGTLIQKGDERAFSAAILAELERPDKVKIQQANKMVLEQYMNSEIAMRFEMVYLQVVKKEV